MTLRRCVSVVICFIGLTLSVEGRGQQAPAKPVLATAGGDWHRVQALPVRTMVHVTLDHGGHTCRIFSVTDDTLTCEKGLAQAGRGIPRAVIRNIKLTRYLASSLIGFGFAGGIGATVGVIAGRTQQCHLLPGELSCESTINGGPALSALVIGVPSAVIGGIIGGTTDMARGGTIYIRP